MENFDNTFITLYSITIMPFYNTFIMERNHIVIYNIKFLNSLPN